MRARNRHYSIRSISHLLMADSIPDRPVTFFVLARPRVCMKTKICPRHHDLTQKLLLGLLDDHEAMEAEELFSECPQCAAEYENICNSEDFEVLSLGVADGLAGVIFPSRRKNRRWVGLSAMAAAATLMLVGGLHWARLQSQSSAVVTPLPKTIARIDFEKPSAKLPDGMKIRISNPKIKAQVRKPGQNQKDLLFSNGAEDGSLKGWSIHT